MLVLSMLEGDFLSVSGIEQVFLFGYDPRSSQPLDHHATNSLQKQESTTVNSGNRILKDCSIVRSAMR